MFLYEHGYFNFLSVLWEKSGFNLGQTHPDEYLLFEDSTQLKRKRKKKKNYSKRKIWNRTGTSSVYLQAAVHSFQKLFTTGIKKKKNKLKSQTGWGEKLKKKKKKSISNNGHWIYFVFFSVQSADFYWISE